MDLSTVSIDKPEAVSVVLGQSHFIKTVEDIHEVMVGAVPGVRFGLAFCESSGERLVRVTGTDGMMEVDTQDRGARCCLRKPTDGRPQEGSGMQTPNLGFFRESRDKLGRPRYSGYGIESIQDFAENVGHLIAGGSLDDRGNTYASGRDGLEASRIAVAVHRSMEAGGALVDVSRTL